MIPFSVSSLQRIAFALAVACAATGACQPTSDGNDAHPANGTKPTQSDVDRIRSTGYAGYSNERSSDKRSGAVVADRARVAPGFNLVSVSKLSRADLFDLEGQVLHSWRDENGRSWDHVELAPDGDLLVVGSDRGERQFAGAVCEDHYVARLAFDGAQRWKLPLHAHHEIQPLADGNWITLTANQRHVDAVDTAHDIVDNGLAILSPDGHVVEESSLYEILSKPESHFEFQKVASNPNPKFPIIDYLHTNAIDVIRDASLAARLPSFALGNLLVCMRHQDCIAVIDRARKVAVWTWGRGTLSGPHDARVLPNGHVLIFDNGIDRAWSRVVEMDPSDGHIVWEYRAADRKSFYSDSQGSSQRLANGNTLIGNSMSGEAFEVAADGTRVWSWLAPYFNEDDQRAAFYRIRRYDAEFVNRLLAEHGGAALPGSK